MNKSIAIKPSTNLNQRTHKSNNNHNKAKSIDNKNKNKNMNKVKQSNKIEILNNATNSNKRAKSNKNNKNKINRITGNNNSNSIKKNYQKQNKKIYTNPHIQKRKIEKIEKNNENISENVMIKSNCNTITNINHFRINPLIQSNPNNNTNAKTTSSNFNNTKINNNKKFQSDINNPNFFDPKKEKVLHKTELKKISNKLNLKEGEKTIPNFENLKYISLEDTDSLFNAWQNCSMIYKIFEEKIMKKNNFEINKNTLELISKNSEACQELTEQKFWILYIEYLINNNLLINEKQFLSVINEAFSYMTYNCAQLRIYYLQKIKKYAPVYLSDGTFDDSDETYINKLNESTINFIKRQKGVISSNIKLKSANKQKLYKLEKTHENKENMNDNIIKCLVHNGGKF